MTTIDNKNIKCAVFDLDGTLLNTIKTIHFYLNLSLRENGLSEIDEQSCMSFVGDGAVKLVERALSHIGINDEDVFRKVFADYNKAYDADPYYLTEPYPEIINLVSLLASQGIKIAVLSNKPDFATRAAVAHFFGNSFSYVAGARDGVRLKPAPDSLLSILSVLDVDPSETVYIGDSDQDIMTAKNAFLGGCISVTWGFRSREELISSGATKLVDYPSDIIKMINYELY